MLCTAKCRQCRFIYFMLCIAKCFVPEGTVVLHVYGMLCTAKCRQCCLYIVCYTVCTTNALCLRAQLLYTQLYCILCSANVGQCRINIVCYVCMAKRFVPEGTAALYVQIMCCVLPNAFARGQGCFMALLLYTYMVHCMLQCRFIYISYVMFRQMLFQCTLFLAKS